MVEVNDESRGTYNVNSQIEFKNSMLRWSLYDHSGAYIIASATITVPITAVARASAKNIKI